MQSDNWSGVNKIALPLHDDGYEFSRVLAIWRPTSHDGLDPWSSVDTYTLAAGREQPIEVQVFSASLYVSRLLAEQPDAPHLTSSCAVIRSWRGRGRFSVTFSTMSPGRHL